MPYCLEIKEDRVISKVPLVLDICSKIEGPTVRDCLYAGYLVAEALLSFFFLRFLGNKIVFIADIEKEFSQISWKHEHRAFVLFLWYENENETYSENIYQSKICD